MGKKVSWKPGTMLYPLPAVLVSCGKPGVDANLITIAWAGTVCTNPPMVSISVRPERHSHALILRDMEFTINLTTEDMARATDFCGVRSGRDCDKWAMTGLTPCPGVACRCPAVAESPLSIECKVKSVTRLGSHDMIIAEVVNVLADEDYFDSSTGRFELDKAGLIHYTHGAYHAQGRELGHFGFSVRKKETKSKPKSIKTQKK